MVSSNQFLAVAALQGFLSCFLLSVVCVFFQIEYRDLYTACEPLWTNNPNRIKQERCEAHARYGKDLAMDMATVVKFQRYPHTCHDTGEGYLCLACIKCER